MAENRRSLKWPKRGEVYLTRFDPTVGAEIQKTRPALIVQNDVANRYSPITIVAAITSQPRDPSRPTNIRVDTGEGGLTLSSTILLNQIRSMDKQRLGRFLGSLTPETMQRVDRALMISLGLVEL
jgi:mRNA interferase MazF